MNAFIDDLRQKERKNRRKYENELQKRIMENKRLAVKSRWKREVESKMERDQ